MNTSELVSCPFCGSANVELHTNPLAGMSWVACIDCGLEAPSETGVSAEDAVTYWNRRAPQPEAVVTGDLSGLRAANISRQAIWCPDEVPDLSFRGLELGGEVGEAQNVMKKLERERLGWRGSRDTLEHLAEELADVVICADLCALSAGVDLAAAVVAKFNATSDKVGIDVKLPAALNPEPGAAQAREEGP